MKVLTKNTANAAGSGEVMNMNFIEFVNRDKAPVDERTADEIIEDIGSRLDALGGKE